MDTTTNKITTNQSHNISTATGVKIKAATTLPSPLVASTTYYASAASATEITLHPTALDATNNTNTVVLDVAKYPAGVYFLSISNAQGVATAKVIKQ